MFGFFNKDYRHHMEKGEKYLQQGRYVDAKYSFNNALEKVDKTTGEGKICEASLLGKLVFINNTLAEMNLKEAQHSIDNEDFTKANEHLQIVLELAEDVTLREKAEKLLAHPVVLNDSDVLSNINGGCSGCKSSHAEAFESSATSIDDDAHLSLEEKFELLISTLPYPLSERYASLGKEFACSYVSIHDGQDDKALKALEQILQKAENDIIYYELALINYRQGDINCCERYLKKAIELKPDNPLCYLALVQLLIEKDHASESIPLLNHMIDSNLLPGQAHLILGDVYYSLGDEQKTIDILSKALALPGMARPAAEALVPLLLKTGRSQEADFLKKQYLNKCC